MDITLNAWQSQVVRSEARYKVLRCGRRAGKTYLSCVLVIAKAMEKKGIYWFVAPYYRQAKEIAWQIFNELIPRASVRKRNEQELSFILRNGSEIKLKGADSPDSLKGVGIDGIVLDEYAFFKPSVWQEVIRPMLYDRGGWALFISTPQGYNHFYDLWEQAGQLEGWDRFHFTTMDNPKISGSEIEASRREMSTEKFAQEVLAEFTKIEGAVWKEFSRDLHVVPKKQPDKANPIYGSLDFGFSIGHPTAFLLHEVNQEQVYTFDGFLTEQLDPNSLVEKVRSFTAGLNLRTLYCDSARPDLIEMLSKAGLPAQPAKKDVELGIAKVGEFMKLNELTQKPKWAISEHLKEAIYQIENYQWEQYRGEDGNFKSRPKKENDDSCFAKGTKILTIDGDRNIEDINAGDYILTPFGKTKVLEAGLTGIKNIVKFNDTKVTPNHKILTPRGFVGIDTLRYSDIILVWLQKQLIFKALTLEGIQILNPIVYASIIFHLLTRSLGASANHSTGLFGNHTMGKFLRAFKYTIKMATHLIIPLVISSVLHRKNIMKDTEKKEWKKEFGRNLLKKQGEKLQNGINLNREEVGIKNTVSIAGKLKNSILKYVQFVLKNIKLLFPQDQNTAIKTVKLQHLGEEEVYNLATENGTFVANGIVYSNCDSLRYFLFSFTQVDTRQAQEHKNIFKKLTSYNPWK